MSNYDDPFSCDLSKEKSYGSDYQLSTSENEKMMLSKYTSQQSHYLQSELKEKGYKTNYGIECVNTGDSDDESLSKSKDFGQFEKEVESVKFDVGTSAELGAYYARVVARAGKVGSGEFAVEKQLGGGSFGAVHLGKIEGTRVVAIKVAGTPITFDSSLSFLREMRLCSVLKKKFKQADLRSAAILGLFVHNGAFHAAFELATRGSVEGLLLQNLLTPLDKWVAALHTAKALAQIHSARIIHLDVAARNLLGYLTPDRKTVFKLCDFGCSERLPHGKTWVHRPVPALWPSQSALETLTAFWVVGAFSDVWQFGVLLVELFAHGKKMDACLVNNHKDPGANLKALNEIQTGAKPYVPVAIPAGKHFSKADYESLFSFPGNAAWKVETRSVPQKPTPDITALIKLIEDKRPSFAKLIASLSKEVADLAAAQKK